MQRSRIAIAAALALVATVQPPTTDEVSAQAPATIRVTAPAAGSTVSSPVTLAVDIANALVKPAAEGDPNAFHYHILIDVDPATVVQAGQPLPTGQANIIHTANLREALPTIAPGPHTVTTVLTRTDHVPLSPSVQDRVQFTVAAAAQATPAPAGQPAQPGQLPAGAPRVGAGVTTPTPATIWLGVGASILAAAGWLLIRRRARV